MAESLRHEARKTTSSAPQTGATDGALFVRTTTKRAFLVAAVAVAVVLPGMASAGLGPRIGFEAPTYVPGTINGQDGWMKTGPYDAAVVSNIYGYATFQGQSLRISNAVTSGSFGDHTFSKPLVHDAGEATAETGGMSDGTRNRYFQAQWDFASTVPGALQTGLSVVASPDRGDGARMSWVQMADTPSGLEVNFFDYQAGPLGAECDGEFVQSNVATGLDRTVPHTIKITMELKDGRENDLVQVYIDGQVGHTGTSWEDYFRDCEDNPTRTVDSILFRVGGAPAPTTAGNGFLIDNFLLCSGRNHGACQSQIVRS